MMAIYRKWRYAFVIFIALWASDVMADATSEKFALIQAEEEANAEFEFEDTNLSFVTRAPGNFVWNDSDAIPTGFIEASVFTELTERAIGYDPLNRDRFEVRIYTGKVFPDRVLLGTGYAQLFASQWGRQSFGTMAHSPTFGEVLGGTDASGLMIINRISVIRRGAEVLVIRSKFHAEHFETYAADIATIIGSVAFTDSAQPDPIAASMQTHLNVVGPTSQPYEYQLPGHWDLLAAETTADGRGGTSAWNDPNDASSSLALMVFTKSPPPDVVITQPYQPDPQTMANLSFSMAETTMQNLLPSPDFVLAPANKTTFGELNEVAAFNGLFTFRGEVGPEKTVVRVSVLLSVGEKGETIGSVAVAPAPQGQYLFANGLIGDYINGLQLASQTAYWTARKEETAQ